MARNIRKRFLLVFALLLLFFLLHHYHHRETAAGGGSSVVLPPHPDSSAVVATTATAAVSFSVITGESLDVCCDDPPESSPPHDATAVVPSTAVLLPDWEVLVIVSPDFDPRSDWDVKDPHMCVFDDGVSSPAFFAGILNFPDRFMFKCEFPIRARRRRLPYKKPVMIRSTVTPQAIFEPPAAAEMLRWNFIVYDSLTTENDVVLFVKGVNNRQGINREPTEFLCVFYSDNDDVSNAVTTAVTSSMQEVFRCKRPDLTVVSFTNRRVKVSLRILGPDPVNVPTVAYYTPRRTLAQSTDTKSLLCAVTMVHNVAKSLREWVLYHSKIGVERFVLYDNWSDDELRETVASLVQDGFDIATYYWVWPKTQEAGFSHSAVYTKDACKWIMYTDVDEFVYSPRWAKVSKPDKLLLHSFLPGSKQHSSDKFVSRLEVAQVNIPCVEFGPSGRRAHPDTGVTQGYNCRKEGNNRHKSIVLLDAIDESLMNVIHHFILKPGYMSKKVSLSKMVVNHYKFQAWPEFKAKFRRRVSAYVIDWTQPLNPMSNDRTPGLGFSAVEPEDWPNKFCQVYDDGLKNLTRKWFGVRSPRGYKMAWQR